MKQTTQTLKEKYLIPEVEITNFIAEQGFGASFNSSVPNPENPEDEEDE